MEQAHGASLDSLVIELLFRIRATIPRDLGEIGVSSRSSVGESGEA